MIPAPAGADRTEFGQRIGLLHYRREGDQLEVVVLIARQPRQGVGRRLLEAAEEVAAQACRRLLAGHHERQSAGARVLPGRRLAPMCGSPRQHQGGSPPEAADPADRPCRHSDRGRDRVRVLDRPVAPCHGLTVPEHRRLDDSTLANLFMRAGRRRAAGGGAGADVLLSYGQLAARRGAGGAPARGVRARPGDRVALVMKNVPEYVELLLAGWYAGLTMVPANAKLHARELEYILDHSGARVCFVTPDLSEAIAPLEHSVEGLERIVEVGSAEYRACSPAIRRRSPRSRRTTSPGCSTRAAPRASRRARC